MWQTFIVMVTIINVVLRFRHTNYTFMLSHKNGLVRVRKKVVVWLKIKLQH